MKSCTWVCTGAVALGLVQLWSGLAGAQTHTPAEQILIEDLVLANRMLASEEIGINDAFGHVSARSPSDPSRFFISRYVAPGLVIEADIIENDLDSRPVEGERSDQYLEVFIHGEIYKARPDVMAVVHAHTPELVAFGISDVPLLRGDDPVPVFENGALINSPDLGQQLAGALGSGSEVLQSGHGAVIVSDSIYNLVQTANGVRRRAQLQQMMISMGGTWDPNPRRVTVPQPEVEATGPPPPGPPAQRPGEGGSTGWERAWGFWKNIVSDRVDGPNRLPRSTTAPAAPVTAADAAANDLVLASQMMVELGINDAMGHVSVRNPDNPDQWFISRNVAVGTATRDDIVLNDFDGTPAGGERSDQFLEIYIHGEIYRVRSDVNAVVHAHTPELLAFANSSVRLRPVTTRVRFIGDGLPEFDIREFDPRESIVSNSRLGRQLAQVLGDAPGAIMTGHGVTIVASSLPNLVSRAYNLRMNAVIQQQAIALGGEVDYLEPGPQVQAPDVLSGPGGGFDRAWEYWKQIVSEP